MGVLHRKEEPVSCHDAHISTIDVGSMGLLRSMEAVLIALLETKRETKSAKIRLIQAAREREAPT